MERSGIKGSETDGRRGKPCKREDMIGPDSVIGIISWRAELLFVHSGYGGARLSSKLTVKTKEER